MKESANFKKIIGKELDDQAESPVKYYLVITTFTCGRENFLELDGRSFESLLSTIWAESEQKSASEAGKKVVRNRWGKVKTSL